MFRFYNDLNKLRPLFTRRDKWNFVVLLVLMFIGAFFEAVGIGVVPAFVALLMKPSSLAQNKYIGDWFSGLPDEPTLQIILWASALFFGFILLKNVFLSVVFYVQAKIVTSQQLRLGDRMFRAYQSAPYEWHLSHSSSELQRSIQNDTAQVLRGVLMPFLDLTMGIIMSTIIIAVMVFSMPGTALLSLLVTGVGLFLVIILFQKKLRYIGHVSWQEHEKIIKAIQQGFGALVDARIIGCEKYLSRVHRDSLERQTKVQCQQIVIQKTTAIALETFAIFGLLFILLLLTQTASSLGEVLPVMVLLGVATIRLKQMASKIAGSINQMNTARAYIPTITKDLHDLDRFERLRKAKEKSDSCITDLQELRLENVTYFYPNTKKPSLDSVSLQMDRGQAIAFVGATGCGKSTLVSVILGLLEPKSGSVRVNGVDIQQDLTGWRSQLGYIPQSIFLIDDTIRSNVAFGVPTDEVNEQQLGTALRSACLDEFIATLPMGDKTVVGEQGIRLSGGQRQRLGIARALYQEPEVLIMDEATSALDNTTEVEVMKAIQNIKKGRTLILIAHRLSTVETCDRLFYMRDGRIEQSGSYETLKKISPSFREMAVGGTHNLISEQ